MAEAADDSAGRRWRSLLDEWKLACAQAGIPASVVADVSNAYDESVHLPNDAPHVKALRALACLIVHEQRASAAAGEEPAEDWQNPTLVAVRMISATRQLFINDHL